MKWINRLYILFLGILLSVTTGFGVAAFYPQPISPDYPVTPYTRIVPESCYQTPQSQASVECQAAIQKQQDVQLQEEDKRKEYEENQKVYNNKNASYTRTAIFFGIVIGAFFALVGLLILHKSRLIANGLLLAGILTAILTRVLIGLASLGASVTGTSTADPTAIVEFGVLLFLSLLVLVVGFFRLND